MTSPMTTANTVTNNNNDIVSLEVVDYFMDTGYSSDPSKFQVKQVLLNVVLDTKY